MHLLVACAAPDELRVVKQKMQTYKVPHCQVSFLCTGIGMYETIHKLTKYLEQPKESKVDFLLNIGICGYITKESFGSKNERENDNGKKHVEVPKVVQVATTKNIHTTKERITPPYFSYAPMVSFICSEKPLLTINHAKNYEHTIDFLLRFQEVVYVDMESRAIDYLCDMYKIPRLLLKVPYDHVVSTFQKNEFSKKDALEKLIQAIDYRNLLETIMQWRNENTPTVH